MSIFSSVPANERPKEALKRLLDGNARYASDQLRHARNDTIRREQLVFNQKPFAIILGCSDSRVPVEIIFDQDIGDLFVVRVAGNVAGAIEMESIEFAAASFGSVLIFVMGHQHCGAVTAVIEGKTDHMESIAKLIEPSAKKVPLATPNRIDITIEENVKCSIETLKSSPILGSLISEGKLQIAGGIYSLETGAVTPLKT